MSVRGLLAASTSSSFRKTSKYVNINHLQAVPSPASPHYFPGKHYWGSDTSTSLAFPPLWSILSSRRNNTEVAEPHVTNICVHLAARVHPGSRFIPLALAGEQGRGKCVGIDHANACDGNLARIICVRATHSSRQKDKANSSASQIP